MSKLFKLKNWLTIPEVAKHLASMLGEDVSEADVLRLGMDRRLNLSVIFLNHVYASLCRVVDETQLMYEEIPKLDGSGTFKYPRGGMVAYSPSGEILQVEEKVFSLDEGIYQIGMVGGEYFDLQQKFWDMTGETREVTSSLDGVYVSEYTGKEKKWYQLKGIDTANKKFEPAYFPLGSLPESTVIVVTANDLNAFAKSLEASTADSDKPLSTTERNTLLRLLIGMAIKGYAHDPYAGKNTAPKEIADDLAALGLGVSDDTVRKYLKEAASTVLPASLKKPV